MKLKSSARIIITPLKASHALPYVFDEKLYEVNLKISRLAEEKSPKGLSWINKN